jgi:hypothetical protein
MTNGAATAAAYSDLSRDVPAIERVLMWFFGIEPITGIHVRIYMK